MAEEQILVKKLDEFIRKYYKNRLMRGLLLAFSMLAIYYLLLVISEYFFHFNQLVRAVLFFTFLLVTLFLFIRLICIPILQLIRIGKVITYDRAAEIVGNHFPEIQDKLLNTLQLIKSIEHLDQRSDLLTASIDQKTKSLKVFQFTTVVDFRKNIRYLRYALLPLVIFILIVILAPKIISDPTSRIVQFDKQFIQPTPFTVSILNEKLEAIQQHDFELKVEVSGKEIPSEFYIKTGDVSYRMIKEKGFVFTYLFKSLKGNILFKIAAGEYSSPGYEIMVVPKPILLGFDIEIFYPKYIGKQSEKTENIGDIIIPEGAQVSWNFYTRDVSEIGLRIGEKHIFIKDYQNEKFTYADNALKSSTYCIKPINDKTNLCDSLVYRINVINDGFPTIFVAEESDSTLKGSIFFKGTIKDDYGFTRLTFNYSMFSNGDSSLGQLISEKVQIENSVNNQLFFYSVDPLRLLTGAGMKLRYYFEVWDNDGIHGPKSSKTEIKIFSTPTIGELVQNTENNEQIMKNGLEQSMREAKSVQNTIDDLNKRLVDKNSISWQEKRKLEDLLKANLLIEDQVNEAIRKNLENIQNENKYLNTSKRITEKQKQLNELMEQLLTVDMKKMIDEMRELLKQVDKSKLASLMEKLKISNRDLEIQLDRNLALMKQIEFDRKLEAVNYELKKSAEKQETLAIETMENKASNDKLLQQQNKIVNQVDSLFKSIDELKIEGEMLETPADLGKTSDIQDSIHNTLNESKNRLGESNNREAAKSQKKAARQMRELAKQMEDSQQENEEEQMEEDAQNIRMILENLVRLSFEQESLIINTRIMNRTDPRYPGLIVRQRELGEKLDVVEDSLIAIYKRQIVMKPFVTKEIGAIRQNIDLSIDAMDNHNINMAVAKQQYSMTAINNLAVMLNESLEKMNEKMSLSMNSKGGKKSCNNPSSKGGKMTAKSLKDLQNKIGQQLQQLKSGMEQRNGAENGSRAQQNSLNKQIAKLAAQQEALRSEMQRYQDEQGSKGVKDQGGLAEAAKEMEQVERDLVNKNITQETIRRQQKIMTRLLESEKAEQTREQEEKRESTEAKDQKFSNPEQKIQYNNKKKPSLDNIQLSLPVVSSFYKSKVNSYIVKIGY